MVLELQSFKIPGRNRSSIPIVRKKEENDQTGISKSTPEWIVSIPAAGEIQALELFGFSHGATRENVGHSVNHLIAGSATHFSSLSIIVQLNIFSPIFEQQMNNGTLLENVTIVRNGWVKGAIVELEKRIFSTCYITRFTQILDYVVLEIRTCDVEENVNIYDQSGNKTGAVISKTSTTTGLVS